MRVLQSFAGVVAVALLHFASTVSSQQQEYDVVIVGSGPGGLVAAEFLSRNPAVSVLILEAGLPSTQITGGTDVPDYAKAQGWTKFDIPGEFESLRSSPENDKYRVDWINGPESLWLGKLVGGNSAIGALLYSRATDAYFTNAKWPFSADHVDKLSNENEDLVWITSRPSAEENWYLQEGFNIVSIVLGSSGYSEKSPIPWMDGRESKNKTYGHPRFSIRSALRDCPAKMFWYTMKDRSNVKLVTSAVVDYIKQDQGQATGVVYNSNVEVKLSARGAVMMAAGALSTPKVLIQSGIGPRDQLDLLSARSDFPGAKQSQVINANVGQNLFDASVVYASFSHVSMKSFDYKARPASAVNQYMAQGRTGPWASPGPALTAFESYAVNNRTYDFQATVLSSGHANFSSLPTSMAIAIHVNNPEARTSSFFTADGKWNAFKDSLNLATPNDLAAMQSYATKIVSAMKGATATFLSAADNQSVADWVSAQRDEIAHHFGGSCYVSSDAGDSQRCADEKLRVLGTKNIFVADASAMRVGMDSPYAFVMYVGREAASQVQEVLQLPPVATPGPPSCALSYNVDFVGNDIAERPSKTPEACCDICSAHAGCNAFSWTKYNNGTCWLKSAKGAVAFASGTISSHVNVDPAATCAAIDENFDYSGENLGAIWSATAEHCCDLCAAKEGCGAYTWTNYDGGTCWLKRWSGIVSYLQGARSAVVRSAPKCNMVSSADYVGNDLASAWAKTAGECCDKCHAHSGCKAFTWTKYDGGTCWLKSAAGKSSYLVDGVAGTI